MANATINKGWQSPEDSQVFAKSTEFAAVMENFKPVMSGPPEHYFIHFKPFAPREGLSSPFVEMITIRNCTANEDELRATIEKSKGIEGVNACACGYSPDVPSTFTAVVAWKGLEISRAADKSYIPSQAGTLEVHHVNYNFPVKGFRGL